MANCELNQIFLGEIASIQNYGAFIRIPGCSVQGLIHRSQVLITYIKHIIKQIIYLYFMMQLILIFIILD